MCVHVTIEVRYVKIDEKYVAHIELSLKKTLLDNLNPLPKLSQHNTTTGSV